MNLFPFFKFVITQKKISYISQSSFFSESVKLKLEDVSDSEILFNDQLNVKELDNNEKGVANIACFRSLNIYFFATIVKTIVSYWFPKIFEDVFIACDPLAISFFVWNGFWITVASSYIFIHHQF